ncbi:hypothetical protein [Halocatena marina]|uniref:Uncharacterized protein n=1 Tax=Halocatena marina TaxID=2934937 RepID=A0ABD5YX70_9EURY|nr:hypothetical protein [Halocatena marina]
MITQSADTDTFYIDVSDGVHIVAIDRSDGSKRCPDGKGVKRIGEDHSFQNYKQRIVKETVTFLPE